MDLDFSIFEAFALQLLHVSEDWLNLKVTEKLLNKRDFRKVNFKAVAHCFILQSDKVVIANGFPP